MTHGEAIELIKNGGLAVRLLVRRGKAPNSAFLDQAGLSPTSPTPVSVGRPVSSLSQPGAAQSAAPHGGPGPVSHSSPRYPPPNHNTLEGTRISNILSSIKGSTGDTSRRLSEDNQQIFHDFLGFE